MERFNKLSTPTTSSSKCTGSQATIGHQYSRVLANKLQYTITQRCWHVSHNTTTQRSWLTSHNTPLHKLPTPTTGFNTKCEVECDSPALLRQSKGRKQRILPVPRSVLVLLWSCHMDGPELGQTMRQSGREGGEKEERGPICSLSCTARPSSGCVLKRELSLKA